MTDIEELETLLHNEEAIALLGIHKQLLKHGMTKLQHNIGLNIIIETELKARANHSSE